MTNIISLIRFAIGESNVLEPYTETVNERFDRWLSNQKERGRAFTGEQIEWLMMIRDHIAASLSLLLALPCYLLGMLLGDDTR